MLKPIMNSPDLEFCSAQDYATQRELRIHEDRLNEIDVYMAMLGLTSKDPHVQAMRGPVKVKDLGPHPSGIYVVNFCFLDADLNETGTNLGYMLHGLWQAAPHDQLILGNIPANTLGEVIGVVTEGYLVDYESPPGLRALLDSELVHARQ